ncbi:MAG: Clp protease ClpP [Ruminococcus sp.]|nr:Clp protease ClpP [Ruminococcus sp.]
MSKFTFTRKDKVGKPRECGYMKYDRVSGDSAALYFYGDICGESWESRYFDEDKAPQDIVDFLSEINEGGGTKRLDVYINSGGGSVFGGIAIYNILSRYQGEKVAHIDGIAASIAGIIPFACDKVIARASSQLMLHKPWSICAGNADDMKKCIESLNICEQSIISIYAEHAVNGTTADKIKSMIDRETWLTCEQASQYFDIEIEPGEAAAACISESYGLYRNAPESLRKSAQPEPEEQADIHRKRKLQLMHDCMSSSFQNKERRYINDKT